MDVVAVPAFLAYRAGDLFVNLTAVVDLLPDSAISFDHDHDDDDSDVGGGIFGIDVCSLETFLQRYVILSFHLFTPSSSSSTSSSSSSFLLLASLFLAESVDYIVLWLLGFAWL